MTTTNVQPDVTRCPACGLPGKAVKAITLESLLRPDARARMPARADWRFCTNPDCAVAYFAGPDAPVFHKDDLTVRVGIKEREAPRLICYCFNHTIEEIEEEVRRTGRTMVLDDIKTRMKEACWCETKSPLGSCCLSTVSRYVNAALEKHGKAVPASANTTTDCCATDAPASQKAVPDCCASTGPSLKDAAGFGVPPSAGPGFGVPPSGGSDVGPAKAGTPNLGPLSLLGGLLAAVLASACCWLPLLLLAFGVSGVAVSATLEKYRPLFATLTFAFLGAAFYFAYRPRPKAAAGAASQGDACCATPAGSETCRPPDAGKRWTLQKFHRAMLWVVTVVALAFAFFPNYVGTLLGKGQNGGFGPDTQTLVVTVSGMDCPACAAGLEKQLKAVPGVTAVQVNYEKQEALIGVPKGATPPRDAILQVISEAGFTGRFSELATHVIPIAGMTCEACAAHIQSELARVPGVRSAKVSFSKQQAIVVAAPSVDAAALRKAVEAAGYQVAETAGRTKGK